MEDNRAVIYARVSTEDQDENHQISECKSYIKTQGLELKYIYQERASAYKKGGKYREEFNQLIEDAKSNKFKHIVVWNFDRMFRNHKQAIDTIRFYSKAPYRIQFHFLNNAKIFNSIREMEPPLNEMMYDIILHYESWRSQEESENRSRRVKKAFAHRTKKWGRPSVSNYLKNKVLNLRKNKLSIREIAEQVKISKSAVHKIITENTKSGGNQK